MPSTGKTQGIRFKIKPPMKAKPRVASKLLGAASAVGGGVGLDVGRVTVGRVGPASALKATSITKPP